MTNPKTLPTTVEEIIQNNALSPTARLILIFLSDLVYDRQQDIRTIERRTGLTHPTVTAAMKSLVDQGKVLRHSVFGVDSISRPAVLFSALHTLGIPPAQSREGIAQKIAETNSWTELI